LDVFAVSMSELNLISIISPGLLPRVPRQL